MSSVPYSTDVKRQTEQLFCDAFNDDLPITFFPSKGDEERELPFGAVYVEEAKTAIGDRTPRGYICKVKVVYVSHIHEVGAQEHSENLARIEDVLTKIADGNIASSAMTRFDLLTGTLRTKADSNFLYFTDDVTRVVVGDYVELPNETVKVTGLAGDSVRRAKDGEIEERYLMTDSTQAKGCRHIPFTIYRKIIEINGIHVDNLETNSEDHSFADVFNVIAGVSVLC